MNTEPRIQSLQAKHQTLEDEIAEELGRPLPDDIRISDLKRRKLQVKEELQALAAETQTAPPPPQEAA